MADNSINQHQQELESKLWAMANSLRGSMEAYEEVKTDGAVVVFEGIEP